VSDKYTPVLLVCSPAYVNETF